MGGGGFKVFLAYYQYVTGQEGMYLTNWKVRINYLQLELLGEVKKFES